VVKLDEPAKSCAKAYAQDLIQFYCEEYGQAISKEVENRILEAVKVGYKLRDKEFLNLKATLASERENSVRLHAALIRLSHKEQVPVSILVENSLEDKWLELARRALTDRPTPPEEKQTIGEDLND